ncbi:MAG: Plasmid stabilization system protein [Candidatus Methanolliviera sp. GoM_oil]|nr:MAG: Plasmid stabilization system protein [Candidatus Methanolliviera sp. GoM_oil]
MRPHPHEILICPKANDFLTRQDKDISQRIETKLIGLRDNPELGEHLKHSKYWRLRSGKYRTIYEIAGEKIIAHIIGHRNDVYNNFSKFDMR